MLEFDLFSLIVTEAWAQDAAGAPQGGGLGSFIPLILIVLIFYFIVLRPQQKKIKQHEEMVKALRRGDKVVTSGGIIGTITSVDPDAVMVKIADGVEVKVVKSTVTEVVTRSEPADKGNSAKKSTGNKRKK